MDKAKEVNEKYEITGKLNSAKEAVKNKAKDVNEKYEITHKLEKVETH